MMMPSSSLEDAVLTAEPAQFLPLFGGQAVASLTGVQLGLFDPLYPQAGTIHTPNETIATLKRYEAAGVEDTIVKLHDAGEIAPVQFFADTVLPAFAGVRGEKRKIAHAKGSHQAEPDRTIATYDRIAVRYAQGNADSCRS